MRKCRHRRTVHIACFAATSERQSSAASGRPRLELAFDAHDPASRPIFDSQLDFKIGPFGSRESRGMNIGVSQ